MTDHDDDGASLIRAIVARGKEVEAERAQAVAPFWARLLAADGRFSAFHDDRETKEEIESLIRRLADDATGDPFRVEWSRPEVVDLAGRVLALCEDLAEIWNDIVALGRAVGGGPLDEPTDAMLWAVSGLVDSRQLADSAVAAQALLAAPGKAGGPGDYTANLRPSPMERFGEAMVPFFRSAGIPLGGTMNRDPALKRFMEIAAEHATGTPIPGLGALLARLRKL